MGQLFLRQCPLRDLTIRKLLFAGIICIRVFRLLSIICFVIRIVVIVRRARDRLGGRDVVGRTHSNDGFVGLHPHREDSRVKIDVVICIVVMIFIITIIGHFHILCFVCFALFCSPLSIIRIRGQRNLIIFYIHDIIRSIVYICLFLCRSRFIIFVFLVCQVIFILDFRLIFLLIHIIGIALFAILCLGFILLYINLIFGLLIALIRIFQIAFFVVWFGGRLTRISFTAAAHQIEPAPGGFLRCLLIIKHGQIIRRIFLCQTAAQVHFPQERLNLRRLIVNALGPGLHCGIPVTQQGGEVIARTRSVIHVVDLLLSDPTDLDRTGDHRSVLLVRLPDMPACRRDFQLIAVIDLIPEGFPNELLLQLQLGLRLCP